MKSTLGKSDRKASAFAFRALNLEMSVMRKHNLLHQRQAKPGALTFRRVERDKHFREHLARDSSAIVLDQDLDVSAFVHDINRHGYDSVFIQSFDCIDQQIHE